MRFVQPKSREQQAVLCLHRARELVVRQRTQIINAIRSLLAEFTARFSNREARSQPEINGS
jgi:transposase